MTHTEISDVVMGLVDHLMEDYADWNLQECGLVAAMELNEENMIISYCSDGRRWVQAGLFGHAARAAEERA